MNSLVRYLILWVMLWSVGCSRYPEVTSPESQSFIQQVYTACNTRDVERLKKCQQKLVELVEANQVGEAEQREFERILELARSGKWEESQEASLDFAKRQVRG